MHDPFGFGHRANKKIAETLANTVGRTRNAIKNL
jgi:hypothetical protein